MRNADYLDVVPISVAAYLATGVAARFTAPKGDRRLDEELIN